MNPLTETSSRYAAQLTRDLLDKGCLDEPWAKAFAQTPRDRFLPSFYSRTADSWELITPDTVGEERWLQLAYYDVTWVQRLHGPNGSPGSPASSCIQPSLAAQMLTALPVHRGSRVCEVGPGTGWLTALLSHRCGAENVTGVELDPELTHQAQATLNDLGFKPTLIRADGFNAHTERAPYDAIISTAAVTHIPQPWLAQTRPGGRIVTPLRGAIALIDVQDQGQATGRFLPRPVQILPLRSPQDHVLADSDTRNPSTSGQTSAVTALRDQRFRFVLGLRQPSLTVEDKGVLGDLLVTDPHGSSVRISPLGRLRAHGPRNIWDAVSDIHAQWEDAGHPGPADFLIEVDKEQQWARMATSPPTQRWRIAGSP